MKKTELKEIAKNILQESIGVAYYKLENENFSADDEKIIIDYINKYGVSACKTFGRDYITY